MNNIFKKLSEYENIMDFKHPYWGKDFVNNFKFTKQAVNRFIKNKVNEKEIIKFIQDGIDIHKRIYC